MNEIVLTVLKEYFEHTTGDVTLEQIETCAQAISEALEAAQQSVQRTGLPTRTELANAYADALLAKKRAKIASR